MYRIMLEYAALTTLVFPIHLYLQILQSQASKSYTLYGVLCRQRQEYPTYSTYAWMTALRASIPWQRVAQGSFVAFPRATIR
jgi:hypothetical protein